MLELVSQLSAIDEKLAHIKERVSEIKEEFSGHVKEDRIVHRKVERHDVYFVLMGVVVATLIGAVVKNWVDASFNEPQGNRGYVYKKEVPE